MSTTSTEMTNVVGYFNSKSYPLHVVISRLNVTLEVKPGKFIVDTLDRKVNDPFFDSYKQLSKETSETPVPLIRIPEVVAPVARVHDGHSVRQVTEYKTDARGIRQPVMPQMSTVPANALNAPSVRAMSVDEARRAGFMRQTRVVPEDYGVPDTDGAPRSARDLPTIKYALDTSRPQPVAQLPQGAETLSDDSRTMKTATARTQLQQALVEGEETAKNLDSETGFMKTVGKGAPNVITALPALPAPEVAACLPEEEQPVEVYPEPTVEEPATELDDAPPAPAPAPAPAPKAKPAPKPLPPKGQFICQADGKKFDFRSQLSDHCKRKYPHMYESLMAPYPADK